MSDTILFVLEGERVEPRILDSLWHSFFRNTGNSNFHVTFDSNIYILWNELKSDPDLDILEVLIERNERNRETIESIKDNISQTFFLFDYDGHAGEASDEDLIEMVNFFCEETEHGKLFISYPMVEAVKHLNPETFQFKDLTFPVISGVRYKEIVDSQSAQYKNPNFNGGQWNTVCSENLMKSNFIVNDNYEYPSGPEAVEQLKILNSQIKKFINPNGDVSVLSAFPLFVYHYFGNGILNRFR